MDPTRFAITLAVLLAVVGLGRFVLTTVGKAADGMATLFVPPDRALGWPHGMQEIDEPWGWHGPARSEHDQAGGSEGHGSSSGSAKAADWSDPPPGTFVVPVAPVDPVHLGVRPH